MSRRQDSVKTAGPLPGTHHDEGVTAPILSDRTRADEHRHHHGESLAGYLMTVASARVFVVFWGGLALCDIADAAGASPRITGSLLVVLTAACSLWLPRTRTLGGALVGWLVFVGFANGAQGQLRWGGWPDAAWLAVFVVAALLAGGRR